MFLNDQCKEYYKIGLDDKTMFKGGEILNGSRRIYSKDPTITKTAIENLKKELENLRPVKGENETSEMVKRIKETRKKVTYKKEMRKQLPKPSPPPPPRKQIEEMMRWLKATVEKTRNFIEKIEKS